ncbi:Hypothetical predicted protein [Octopus vulgaris]|uniref:Uncharacterized protein n=1 Tax=Octopus vulgaris TaxID=6645 RepID=A0AA36BE97_OCTVU|nr:Hypothetical predicted protein [Octopus vulgaris]
MLETTVSKRMIRDNGGLHGSNGCVASDRDVACCGAVANGCAVAIHRIATSNGGGVASDDAVVQDGVVACYMALRLMIASLVVARFGRYPIDGCVATNGTVASNRGGGFDGGGEEWGLVSVRVSIGSLTSAYGGYGVCNSSSDGNSGGICGNVYDGVSSDGHICDGADLPQLDY